MRQILPAKFSMACQISRFTPPLIAQSIRAFLYPRSRAYSDNFEHLCKAITGSKFLASTSDFHGYPFAVHGYHQWRHWAIANAVCKRGDTILEVGANIGTETVGFRDIVGECGRVVAIEPLPSNCERLSKLVVLNGWKNVSVFEMALGDTNGQTFFTTPQDTHMSGVGFIDPTATATHPGRIPVVCHTLDDLEPEVGAATAVFMDCEGAEARILRAGRRYIRINKPAIVLEAAPNHLRRAGSSLDEMFLLLSEAGYEVFRIGRFWLKRVEKPRTERNCNWLCIHRDHACLWRKCARQLLWCGLFPPATRMNPLSRLAR